MSNDEIDDLHRAYRNALSRYTSARTSAEEAGKVFTSIASGLGRPESRMRVWNILCAGVGNDLTTDDKSLSTRAEYHSYLNINRVTDILNEWRVAQTELKDLHTKLRKAGETSNAAPLPPDIKNLG